MLEDPWDALIKKGQWVQSHLIKVI